MKVDLKKIDVKKMDIAKMRSSLLKRRDILLNYVVGFVALFIMFNIFSDQREKAQSLKIQIAAMEKKIAAIAKHDKASKELKTLIESLPTGVPESALIDRISDFAEKSNIHIVTFSPTETEEKDFYRQSRVSLQISADQYKDFVRFIGDLEKFSLNLRVDKWSGSLESHSKSGQSYQEGSEKVLLNISAIYFKKI